MALADWRWYHILGLWVVAACMSAILITVFGAKHFTVDSTTDAFGEMVWPMWLGVLLLVLFLALVGLTTLWLQARTR